MLIHGTQAYSIRCIGATVWGERADTGPLRALVLLFRANPWGADPPLSARSYNGQNMIRKGVPLRDINNTYNTRSFQEGEAAL